MKKVIPVIFILVAAGLAVFLILKNVIPQKNEITRAKTVTPLVDKEHYVEESKLNEYEEFAAVSFIELLSDETLLSVVTMDIDGDSFDDQINIVKSAQSPFLSLVIALYEPSTTSYYRAENIETNITQFQTFACTALDVIGNHKNSLVYQGITDSGYSVLRIYNGGRTKENEFFLNLIGDFESDGTIFIQQQERNQYYELSQAKGESFSVWVYSSQNSEDLSRLDQIQTLYEWDEKEQKYVQTKQIKVAGSRIVAKELARIQDGTVETFCKFLDGLWYKTSVSGSAMRYIFFDYLNQEIIFQFDDSEEVYSWLQSKLRRNGIYFSSVNKSIGNLQRRFDISLVNVDEIRIRIQDDVRMIIGESTLWDGNYKKLSTKKPADEIQDSSKDVIDSLAKGPAWTSSDEKYFIFTDKEYSIESEDFNEKGIFVAVNVESKNLMQFRSNSQTKFFDGYFEPSFLKVTKRTTDKRGRVKEEIVDDTDTIVLQQVIVSPKSYFATESKPLILKRTQLKKEGE